MKNRDDNIPLEKQLKHIEVNHDVAADDLDRRVATIGDAHATGTRSFWIPLLAVAALVVVAFLMGPKLFPAKTQPHQEALVIPTTDACFVLHVKPESKTAALQSCSDLKIRLLHVGDSLGKKELRAVTSETLTWRVAGQDSIRTIADMNTEAQTALRTETEALALRLHGGVIQLSDVDRLWQLSAFANSNALEVLKTMAASPIQEGQIADRCRSVMRLQRMADRVQEGALDSQLMALDALRQAKSPLALHYLQQFAMHHDSEHVAIRSAKAVFRSNESAVPLALEEMATASEYPQIRSMAVEWMDTWREKNMEKTSDAE